MVCWCCKCIYWIAYPVLTCVLAGVDNDLSEALNNNKFPWTSLLNLCAKQVSSSLITLTLLTIQLPSTNMLSKAREQITSQKATSHYCWPRSRTQRCCCLLSEGPLIVCHIPFYVPDLLMGVRCSKGQSCYLGVRQAWQRSNQKLSLANDEFISDNEIDDEAEFIDLQAKDTQVSIDSDTCGCPYLQWDSQVGCICDYGKSWVLHDKSTTQGSRWWQRYVYFNCTCCYSLL